MPPKRKASAANLDGATTSAPAARRASGRNRATVVAQDSDDSIQELAPPKKKGRTSKTLPKSDSKHDDLKKAKASKSTLKKSKSLDLVRPLPTSPLTQHTTNPASHTPSPQSPTTYSDARVLALFNEYKDSDFDEEEATISPEGLMKLCEAANMPMEGVRPILLAWICRARKMGNVYLGEWKFGMERWRIDTTAKLGLAMSELEDVLLSPQPPTTLKSDPATDPYKRSILTDMIRTDRNKSLKDLYTFVFNLSRGEGQRNVDIETATALLTVVLKPRFPIVGDLLAYIEEANGDNEEAMEGEEKRPPAPKVYKGLTKDQWQMTWSFVTTVKPDLSDYDEDGGWPTLFDEFVAWKKKQTQT